MKKLITITLLIVIGVVLSGCSQTQITCGEGTVIKDGKCVAPNAIDDSTGNNQEVTCDTLTGEVFYEVNFSDLQSSFVDNEVGNEHDQNNFVIWGKSGETQLVNNTTVEDGVLLVQDIQGSQLQYYYDTGLGYQFFNFETDTSYTVCAIIEGTEDQKITSELGIYYGHGTKDQVTLTGDKQLIMQDFKPTMSTNVDRGQYVLFTGNVEGDLRVYEIKIVINE